MDNKFEAIDWKKVYDRGIINIGNLSRMKRVINKAASGAFVKVGFIGGSITAGAAATSPETSYFYKVFEWWRLRFPNTKIEYINAGVGATTSKFGVARVEEDVLLYEPDVVFAEFSVNDEDNELFEETFEGLIRKILLNRAEPALFMFNNVFYDDGHNAQRIHNKIGMYYDLPIVSMKESLYHLLETGVVANTDLTADNLHPNDLGHKLLAEVITNLLDKIYDTVMQGAAIEDYAVKTEPLTLNRFITSVRRNNRNTNPELKGFVKDEEEKQGVWDVFRYGFRAKAAGSSICFTVEASRIAIQYRKYAIHPAPIAKVIIDGDVDKAVLLDANFDETWGDKLFLQDIMIKESTEKHTVEIMITDAVKDKEFYLAAVITA